MSFLDDKALAGSLWIIVGLAIWGAISFVGGVCVFGWFLIKHLKWVWQ